MRSSELDTFQWEELAPVVSRILSHHPSTPKTFPSISKLSDISILILQAYLTFSRAGLSQEVDISGIGE